jgi:hypothetical protein
MVVEDFMPLVAAVRSINSIEGYLKEPFYALSFSF